MNIVADAPSGINTTNMFLNTNIEFVDLILWDRNIPCNVCKGLNQIKVTDSKQKNDSKKMMQSKMIQLRKSVSYQNSKRQKIYDIIYSHDFYSNLDIIYSYNYNYYISTLKTIMMSNNVSPERKYKILEIMSRIRQ